MSVDFKTMRSAILESSLRLHVASNGKIIPTRGVNRKRMLEMATEITKMQYKNTLAECERMEPHEHTHMNVEEKS